MGKKTKCDEVGEKRVRVSLSLFLIELPPPFLEVDEWERNERGSLSFLWEMSAHRKFIPQLPSISTYGPRIHSDSRIGI